MKIGTWNHMTRRHLGCGGTDWRIILKWIRKTGNENLTGINFLYLWASLVIGKKFRAL
jgi:hypothetical protein